MTKRKIDLINPTPKKCKVIRNEEESLGSIFQLPIELFLNILFYLSLKELTRLMLTAKSSYLIIESMEPMLLASFGVKNADEISLPLFLHWLNIREEHSKLFELFPNNLELYSLERLKKTYLIFDDPLQCRNVLLREENWQKKFKKVDQLALALISWDNSVITLYKEEMYFLYYAAFILNPKKFKELVETSNAQLDQFIFPYAALSGSWEKVSYMLESNKKSKKCPPIIDKKIFKYACLSGNKETVTKLLEKRPDLIITTKNLNYAARSGDCGLLEMFLKHFSTRVESVRLTDLLDSGIQSGKIPMVEKILALNSKLAFDTISLEYAVKSDQWGMVTYLLNSPKKSNDIGFDKKCILMAQKRFPMLEKITDYLILNPALEKENSMEAILDVALTKNLLNLVEKIVAKKPELFTGEKGIEKLKLAARSRSLKMFKYLCSNIKPASSVLESILDDTKCSSYIKKFIQQALDSMPLKQLRR